VVEAVLARMGSRRADTLADVFALDAEARDCANALAVARAA
jgi:hypothetical protein